MQYIVNISLFLSLLSQLFFYFSLCVVIHPGDLEKTQGRNAGALKSLKNSEKLWLRLLRIWADRQREDQRLQAFKLFDYQNRLEK
jgi:hypothetical protein